MEPEALFPVGPPFFPGSWVPKSYLKSSKFTTSILTHGRWSNTTLDEATNLRQREQQRKERTMQKMARMSDKFRWEIQEVERIQKQVRARQHRIAQANLCACCAVMIQATWRTHQAKMLAKYRRGQKLGQMLVRWWRGFKIRRNVAVVKRFIIAAVSRRRRRVKKKSMAAVKLQRAWRRHRLCTIVGRIILASAATEMVIEDVLVELARRVYLEIKGAVIARAWRKSKRRLSTKNRKGRGGRAFLTQGGASSPRRKPARAGISRNGLTSDPSSYPSRRSPSGRAANKRKVSVEKGFNSPAFLDIISAATSTAAVTTTTERRESSQSSEPPSLSSPSNRKTPSKEYTSGSRSRREKSGVSATSETEGDNGGGERKESPQPPKPSTSLAAGPPDEGSREIGTPKSEASSCGGGDGGGRFIGGPAEDAVVDVVVKRKPSLHEGEHDLAIERTTVPQPRRPSGEKPSRTSDGRSSRSHKYAPGTESGTAADLVKIPGEVPPTTVVADSSRESAVVANRSRDGARPCGDGFGDDDDLGHREPGEAKIDKEDYASDTFESLGELSLTR